MSAMKHRIGVAWVVVLVLLGGAPVALAQAVVKHATVKATTRSFDPAKPPPEGMPKLNGDEAAVTSSKFSCGVKVEVSITPGERATLTVTGIELTLGCSIVEWLPTDATAKIKAHEGAHREITQRYYARAGDVAKRLAQQFVGRTYPVKSADSKDTSPVMQQVTSELSRKYFAAVEAPSQKAQEAFDRITDHGRNDVAEKDAIRQAIGEAGE
jgi:hypothetical protein